VDGRGEEIYNMVGERWGGPCCSSVYEAKVYTFLLDRKKGQCQLFGIAHLDGHETRDVEINEKTYWSGSCLPAYEPAGNCMLSPS
jgi:hypothetical protein